MVVNKIWVQLLQDTPTRLMPTKKTITAIPMITGSMPEPENLVKNSPNKIATAAIEPGPETHILVHTRKNPRPSPHPSLIIK